MMRYAVTALMLAATALYASFHHPANLAAGRGVLAHIPVVFGEWNGTELSFEDAVIDDLQPDDLLVRRYDRGADKVWLCVVYHQNRRFGAHDPRLCYQSQGYLLEPGARVRVDDGQVGGLEVNRFIADRHGDRRIVYYWWATAGLSTTDADAFRGRMALRGALDNRSWGAFVRVEALVRNADDRAADREAGEFAARVAQALPRVFAATHVSAGVQR